MRRATMYFFFGCALFAQSRFEIADVHVSARVSNRYFRAGPVLGGRYELKSATMVDLIRTAYGVGRDKILGGPSWLDVERFDVSAKVPADSTAEMRRAMLQSLLADRFKLVLHKDSRPMPAYALIAGKSPRLKKADGAVEPGCILQSAGGYLTTQYFCRNMTMAAFAKGLRTMRGVSVGPNDVLDQTGLEGSWDFDVKWTSTENPEERITVFDAMEKQLGLKLAPRQVPMPVLVVDTVERNPTQNQPGVEAAFPALAMPTEFEVADIRPTDPDSRTRRFEVEPGGRLHVQGMPLRNLISRAFDTFNNDEVAGIPGWASRVRFDIVAKAPSTESAAAIRDRETIAPLLLALLVDRFKLSYHREDRLVSAYTLVAGKPKMKRADPASRTLCWSGDAPANAAPGSETLTCRNTTMAEFVEELLDLGPGLNWPVLDATGIDGGWDFTLTFNEEADTAEGAGHKREPGRAENHVPVAPDPNGAVSIFRAVEKQLGLKLEMHKRLMPVIVIDHLEQTPTDN